MGASASRYTATAIVLHWAIAGAIVLMIALGLWMHQLSERGVVNDGVFRAYQLHKSIGLTILALSLARLGWRLLNPPPPLPQGMARWERIAATATHWLFYALMIAMPLSGWMYVSAGWSLHEDAPFAIATRWFGLFEVPHLFGLNEASESVRASAAFIAFRAHALMAWTTLALLALHIGAVLKHHFLDEDDGIVARMIPGLPSPDGSAARNPLRLAMLGAGLSLAAVALFAAAFAWSDMARESAAASAPAAPIVAMPAPEVDALPAIPADEQPASPVEPPDAPASWTVDMARSSIGWTFTYSGDGDAQRFNGRFARWAADIRFDPDGLETSNVTVSIGVASATDGVSLHDSALPTPEWFDAAAHPQAEFRTTRIIHLGSANYRAEGQLTLRGQTQAVALPFTLRIEGQRAVMDGRVALDRRAFGVGNGADADSDVSSAVEVVVHVEATRNP